MRWVISFWLAIALTQAALSSPKAPSTALFINAPAGRSAALSALIESTVHALALPDRDVDFAPISTGCTYNHLMWTPGYRLVALLRDYELTGKIDVLDTFVVRASTLLATRDARAASGEAYAWVEPVSGYVWPAYTSHIYIPMLMFDRLLMAHSDLRTRQPAATSMTYAVLADAAVRGYRQAMQIQAQNFRSIVVGGSAQAYFISPSTLPAKVPSCEKLNDAVSLRDVALPINMNSLIFHAMLLYSDHLKASGGSSNEVRRIRDQVAAYVRYLTATAFKSERVLGRDTINWSYREPIARRPEDLPHANVTINFIVAAYEHKLGVSKDTMWRLGNTFYNIIPESGPLLSNSLRPDVQLSGTKGSIYYWPLLVKYNSDLKKKFDDWLLDGKYQPHFEALVSYLYAVKPVVASLRARRP